MSKVKLASSPVLSPLRADYRLDQGQSHAARGPSSSRPVVPLNASIANGRSANVSADSDRESGSDLAYMERLTRSRLVADCLLRNVSQQLEKQRRTTARDLAQLLVEKRVLSLWQSRQLLAGRTAFYVGPYKILERRQFDSELITFIAEDIRLQRLVTCRLDVRLAFRDANVPECQRLFSWWKQQRHANLIALRELPALEASNAAGLAVLDYEEGPAISDVIRARGPMPWRQAARLTAQFAAMLQQIQPDWMSSSVNLSEFQLGQFGQLRWSPLQALLQVAQDVTPFRECRWGQQVGLMFLMLVSDAETSAAEWLLRFQRRRAVTLTTYPVWEQLPPNVRQVIERLVTVNIAGLEETTSWFLEQSTPVPGAMDLVPPRVHRSRLHLLLRRTPATGNEPLPSCRWGELLGQESPNGHQLSNVGTVWDQHDRLSADIVRRAGAVSPLARGARRVLERIGRLVPRRRIHYQPLLKARMRSWLPLAGLLLAAALGTSLEPRPTGLDLPSTTTLSMSILRKGPIEQRKSLQNSEFDAEAGFSIGPRMS